MTHFRFVCLLIVLALAGVLFLPAAQAADGAPAAAAAKTAEAAPAGDTAPPAEGLLHWLARRLGLRYVVVFLVLTVNLGALCVINGLAVRRDAMVPLTLVLRAESQLNENRFQEAAELVKNDPSFLGRVLAAGLAQLPFGCDSALAAMREAGSYETLKMEQRLGYVSLIARLAPLLGLIGTIDGLIRAFEAIAPKDSAELIAGAGVALVSTIVGLWIAVVAVTFHHIARDRMNRMVAEAGILGENLIQRFAAERKGKG